MKDIDFDELDRAVNSLMKTVPENPAPKPDDQTRVVTLSTSPEAEAASQPRVDDTTQTPEPEPAPVSAPVLQSESELSSVKEADQSTAEPSATPTPAPAPTPTPGPAARRGRFMDVVRPSAARDSKQPLRASRQGITLQPSGSPEDAPEAEKASPELEPLVQQPEPDSMASTEAASQEDTSTQGESTNTAPEVEDATVAAEPVEEPTPLNSPFLPDAKVDKRPLGRPAEAGPAVDLAAELADSAPEVAADQPVAEDSISPNKDAQLPEQPLPAELDSELLSIETSADTVASEPKPPESSPEVAQPVATPETPAANTAPAPTSATSTARAMAATSIPQQYKVQPSQDQEAPSGAIYDTQPLAHPAKKKPGWLWVIAIIAIILAGAGSGALVYYLGLL